MSLSLLSNATAMAINLTVPFSGTGGTEPYTYAVLAGGAGGTIDASSGIYTSPNGTGLDTIQVTDNLGATATADILVCTPLELVCDIIQNQMNLAQGRVYLWDQKINQPSDQGLFVVIGVQACKPFGNSRETQAVSPSGMNQIQSVNMWAMLSIDIISRGPDARDKKELVILALNSNYAQSQQELNSFYLSSIPVGFTNLSGIDGSAIPYRFQITLPIQYSVTKTTSIPYYGTFSNPSVITN